MPSPMARRDLHVSISSSSLSSASPSADSAPPTYDLPSVGSRNRLLSMRSRSGKRLLSSLWEARRLFMGAQWTSRDSTSVLLLLPDGGVRLYPNRVTTGDLRREFPGHDVRCAMTFESVAHADDEPLPPGRTYALEPTSRACQGGRRSCCAAQCRRFSTAPVVGSPTSPPAGPYARSNAASRGAMRVVTSPSPAVAAATIGGSPRALAPQAARRAHIPSKTVAPQLLSSQVLKPATAAAAAGVAGSATSRSFSDSRGGCRQRAQVRRRPETSPGFVGPRGDLTNCVSAMERQQRRLQWLRQQQLQQQLQAPPRLEARAMQSSPPTPPREHPAAGRQHTWPGTRGTRGTRPMGRREEARWALRCAGGSPLVHGAGCAMRRSYSERSGGVPHALRSSPHIAAASAVAVASGASLVTNSSRESTGSESFVRTGSSGSWSATAYSGAEERSGVANTNAVRRAASLLAAPVSACCF